MTPTIPERFPPLPHTQALNSETFRPPPLDGSLTVPELYDWHLSNTPHHPLMEYVEEDGSIRTILWPEAVRAIHRTAGLVRGMMGCDAKELPEAPDRLSVIGIVAAAGEFNGRVFQQESNVGSSVR